MNKKIAITVFIIVILLILNVQTIAAKIIDKKETSPSNNNSEKGSSKQIDTRGLAKGKNKNKITSEPIQEPSPLPENPPQVNLQVYNDYSCTMHTSSIEWGEIETGGSKSINLYIKNNGEIDSIASLYTENWYPENLKEQVTVSWNYNGQMIPPNELTMVTITIDVSPDCSVLNGFDFDLIVLGS